MLKLNPIELCVIRLWWHQSRGSARHQWSTFIIIKQENISNGLFLPKQSHIYPIWYPMIRNERCINYSAKYFYEDLCLFTEVKVWSVYGPFMCSTQRWKSRFKLSHTGSAPMFSHVVSMCALTLKISSNKRFRFFFMKNQLKLIFGKSVGTHGF